MGIEITGNLQWALPLIFLFGFFILKVPVAFSLLCSCILYFIIAGWDLGLLVESQISRLYYSWILIAVPMFIFVANILNYSNISDHIFNFAKAIVGPKPGALAYVNVVFSIIFAGKTGSAFSDAAGMGKVLCDAMKKDGYTPEFSGAVTAASATLAPTFPPSINMVGFAMLSGASIGGLFLGGIVPGILMSIVMLLYIRLIARRRNFPPGTGHTVKEFLKFFIKVFPALLTPVILMGGIYGGFVTPTEAGALGSAWGILISMLVYRTMGFKTLWRCIKDTALQCAPILMLIACSAPLALIITHSGLGAVVSQLFLNITDNKWVFLLIVNIILIFIGMFLDVAIKTWVILPLILPVVNYFDINLVHFGLVFVVNCMISLITPPYGMLVFIGAGVAGAELKGTFKEVLPFVGMIMVVLFLITYIPNLVLFVPNLLLR